MRPLGIVWAGAILLLFGLLLPDWGPEDWLWLLMPILVGLLGLSVLAASLHRRRVLAALVRDTAETAADGGADDSRNTTSADRAALAMKVLPLYLAQFPGEYHGTSTDKRAKAFARLIDLPCTTSLRPIREASARRSTHELKQLAAYSLLAQAQATPIARNAPSGFALAGVASGEEAGYGPASLALLGGLGLVLPESTCSKPPGDGTESESGLPSAVHVAAAEVGASAQKTAAQVHDAKNPFPGLRPFEPEEASVFFGRGVHTQELQRRLQRNRFLAVVGTSGSGKSSLVRAGLIPALHAHAQGRREPGWRVAILRPGGDPIGALALALTAPEVLCPAPAQADGEGRRLQAILAEVTLRRSTLGLVEVVREARLPAGEQVLVVVDQFEEIFRFERHMAGRDATEEAAAFVKLLLQGSRATDVPLYVVLTMRSDYLGDCAKFRDLPEMINDAQYLIPRLTREQRREAIVEPIAMARSSIKPRLVQRLLNEVGDNPDQLPILQHALMRT